MSHVKRDSARDEEYEVVPVAALRAVESMNLAREKASGREGFYGKLLRRKGRVQERTSPPLRTNQEGG